MTTTILENASIFDGREPVLKPGHVRIEGDRIAEVSETPLTSATARRIDLRGRTLMPGLIDAHFHALLIDVDVRRIESLPPSYVAQQARINLERALARGFTTVRDAAGADHGYVLATQAGLIQGPRLFISGRALSQTGGHGDMRGRMHQGPCVCGQCSCLARLVDGPDALRQAAREELRRGATQLKIFASGGIASPTDPIWMVQYCDEEIRSVVEEASRVRTYVMAHAYTDEAIRRAVDLGVRSIEHGNFLSSGTAERMSQLDTFLVPTLVTYEAMARNGKALGLPQESIDKVHEVRKAGLESVSVAVAAGVKVGFGTDLMGAMHEYQSREFLVRSEVQDNWSILKSATSVNSELLNQAGRLGVIQPEAIADMLVVNGDPSRDLSCLQEQGRHLDMIMQGGRIVKLVM